MGNDVDGAAVAVVDNFASTSDAEAMVVEHVQG